MSKRNALGQGLDALLGEENSGEVRKLPVRMIEPNPNQPRKNFDGLALEDLANSIRQQGVIQPIIVEKQEGGQYFLIAGERRWRAAQMAGLEEIPVLLRTFSPAEKLEIALVENIQREDLTPLEEAQAYRTLMETLNLSQQDVAEKVGKSRSAVANSLRLLKLPKEMRRALEVGKITAGHARALLSVQNLAEQERLFQKIIVDGLSVRNAETAALNTAGKEGMRSGPTGSPPTQGGPAGTDPELLDIEQQFMEALGTKVSLTGDFSRGRMVVSWVRKDALDRIYEILIKPK